MSKNRERRWIKLLSLIGANHLEKNRDRFLAERIIIWLRRVVLSTFLRREKGSATVEASFVIPIFIMAYLAVMQLLWVVLAQLGILNAMYDTGVSLSKMSMVLEDKKYGAVAAANLSFYQQLEDNYVENAGIVGKKLGITLINSTIAEDLSEIYLRADYISTNSFDFVGKFVHNYAQTLYFRGWIGCNSLNRGENVDNSGGVYITDYGEVYHTNRGCAYLNPSINQTTLDKALGLMNESGSKYQPCKSCYEHTQVVYITDYGTAYHSNRNCSGLKRGIMLVNLGDVAGMKLCHKCAQSAKK